MRHTRKGIAGSNPALSATSQTKLKAGAARLRIFEETAPYPAPLRFRGHDQCANVVVKGGDKADDPAGPFSDDEVGVWQVLLAGDAFLDV